MSNSVAIIGAGMAGLSAAERLTLTGHRVTVFDKGRRPGGRTSSRSKPPFGFDHGCQYFTARDPDYCREVQGWADKGWVAPWVGRHASVTGTQVTFPPDLETRWVGAPDMGALCRNRAEKLEVRCGVAIDQILRHGQAWTVKAGPETLGSFDQLVVAVPAPQAAKLLHTVVPEFAHVAAEVTYHPCWAVMAGFDSPLSIPFDSARIESGPLAWAANNGSKPGRTGASWVLHASPAWTAEHLDDDPDHVVDVLLGALFSCADIEPVHPVYRSAHRWLYALPKVPRRDGYMVCRERGIGLCGDGYLAGRLECAYLSGVGLATAMLA